MNAPLPQNSTKESAIEDSKLFQPLRIGDIDIANRVVMAPLTRSRADEAKGDIPGSMMNIEYYRQRSNAGLIISEGTPVAPEGKGYMATPGIYSDAQVEGWKTITTAVIEKSRMVVSELKALRDMGIKLMIDDFGTGYSSMAQLHRLDVDVLKVDRAFTHSLLDGSEGEMLFRAIMSMASALDMCVVAEGVETREQLDVLETLACDEIQGYIISKAISAEDMAQLMTRRILMTGAKLHLHPHAER